MHYNFPLSHVQDLKMHCFSARLSMPELFRFASAEQLQVCYNGIGPDRWSSRFRRFTTASQQHTEQGSPSRRKFSSAMAQSSAFCST